MRLTTTAFADHGWIPHEFAFGRPHPGTHVELSANRNPDLAWSGAPPGTRSFAVSCIDPDVPSRGDDVNQAGKVVPADLPRVDFCHWALVDLPPSVTSLARGEHADGVVARGKPGPAAKHGARQGINDYTGWFAGDAAMAGDYHGYDGPCPPWNDAIVHRYVFTVYALELERLPLMGRFNGADALKVIGQHTLGKASITGTYTLNPRLG